VISWVRIPPGAWTFVCCECCVLSGRGLCDELITRPEESYRMWCVVMYDLENLKNEEAMTRVGSQRHWKEKNVRNLAISNIYPRSHQFYCLNKCIKTKQYKTACTNCLPDDEPMRFETRIHVEDTKTWIKTLLWKVSISLVYVTWMPCTSVCERLSVLLGTWSLKLI
jgi:hypothetical protein